MVCKEDTRIILVWVECPYVQFRAARVTSTWFVVGGYKLAREGADPKSLCVRVELKCSVRAMVSVDPQWIDRS